MPLDLTITGSAAGNNLCVTTDFVNFLFLGDPDPSVSFVWDISACGQSIRAQWLDFNPTIFDPMTAPFPLEASDAYDIEIGV